jgi:hypothetical protein
MTSRRPSAGTSEAIIDSTAPVPDAVIRIAVHAAGSSEWTSRSLLRA